ncbi:hypothetical protein JQC91_10820 [Jannaschia sp. Os4]|nr:hypothetical protein [Jannaschia sp. Os4]MBM2576795.1 hypothetical protein [Jannaschia sp. Os4]
MTDRVAFLVATCLILAVLADGALNDAGVLTFLGRKGLALLGWMAFWR